MIYETLKDRMKARCVIEYLGLSGDETEQLSEHDWSTVIIDNVPRQVEVKIRNKKYDTYLLSKHKHDYLVSLTNPILLVVWIEEREIGLLDISTANFSVAAGGRSDRNDGRDIETCCYYPVDQFKRMNPRNVMPNLWWTLSYIDKIVLDTQNM